MICVKHKPMQKLSQKLITFLNIALITNMLIVTIGFSYWFSLQSQASAQKQSTQIAFKSSVSRLPSIGTGISESKNGNFKANLNSKLVLNQANFKDTSCSSPNVITPSKTIPADLKLSQDGLYGVSKDDLIFKGTYQKTVFYGQNNLNQDLINYILCVMDTTANETALKLQLDIDTDNQAYLKKPNRIIIYDSLGDYTKYYNQAYGSKLGDLTPWGLSEGDTISTFLRLDNSIESISPVEFKDIRYRLTYNISHEYFHHLFSYFRPGYTPFIEEGMAVYMSGRITEKTLGYNMSCTFRLSQSKLANQKTVDLDNFAISSDTKDWYKSNNMSELYAVGYYFILHLDSQNDLTSFTKSFLKNPKFNSESILKLRPEFKTELNKMTAYDKYDCGY